MMPHAVTRHYCRRVLWLISMIQVLWLALPTTVPAQGWQQISTDNYGVHYIDTSTIVVVGAFGRIIRSSDGGEHWVQQWSGTRAALRGVRFLDRERGVVIGDSGIVLRTTDGGERWERRPTGTDENLNAMVFPTLSVGYAVGGAGAVIRTDDAGESWKVLRSGIGAQLRAVDFITPSYGFVVGDSGIILRTFDGGRNWEEVLHDYAALNGISFLDSLHGVAVSYSHRAYYTTDGGTTWKLAHRPVEKMDYKGVLYAASDLIIAYGIDPHGKKLVVSVDGGDTWSIPRSEGLPTMSFVAIRAMSFADDRHRVAVGEYSIISRTTDGGASWDTLSLAPLSVSPDEGIGLSEIFGPLYITTFTYPPGADQPLVYGGGGGVATAIFLNTNDVGTTWRSHRVPGAILPSDVVFLNRDTGLMISDFPTVHRTTDGGKSWQLYSPTTTLPFTGLQAMSFVDRYNGLMVGDSISFKTTDGGESWSHVRLPVVDYTSDVAYVTPEVAIISAKDKLLRSTDGGVSWRIVYERSSGPTTFFMGICFRDDRHGFVASTDGKLFRTSDAGETWDHIQTDGALLNVAFLTDSIGYAMGSPALLLFTNDGGATWTREYPWPPEPSDVAIGFKAMGWLPGDTTVLLVGYGIMVRKPFHRQDYINGGGGNPYLYMRIQPNPSGAAPGLITIYGLYSVPDKSYALKVYDLLGREVADLTPEMQLNGTATIAEVPFDGHDLASGVYLVRFTAGGDSRTARLIIQK